MNIYCILSQTEQGYTEIEEPIFLAAVAKHQCENYAKKVYRGEIELESVPEEHRDTVQNLVMEKVSQYGKFEDGEVSASDTLIAIRKLSYSNITRGEAKSFFSGIEKLRDGATDAVASTAVSAYPQLKKDNSLVKAGTRINWNGVLKRASADLWDTAENNPDNAPDLWENINYRDGYRIIPDAITAGLTFGLDECGWWGDTLYRSKLTANVYTPKQYPAGWEEV